MASESLNTVPLPSTSSRTAPDLGPCSAIMLVSCDISSILTDPSEGKVGGKPIKNDTDHGRIWHSQYFFFAGNGEDHVIDDMALVIQEMAISASSRLELNILLSGY